LPFFNRKRIKILSSVILAILFIFANFYSLRQIAHYGLELYFYDKMLVAYQVGGEAGVKTELAKVLSQEKMPSQLKLAEKFKKKLIDLGDPGKFLSEITTEQKCRIKMLRNLRSITFVLIFLIFISRFIYKRFFRSRDKLKALS